MNNIPPRAPPHARPVGLAGPPPRPTGGPHRPPSPTTAVLLMEVGRGRPPPCVWADPCRPRPSDRRPTRPASPLPTAAKTAGAGPRPMAPSRPPRPYMPTPFRQAPRPSVFKGQALGLEATPGRPTAPPVVPPSRPTETRPQETSGRATDVGPSVHDVSGTGRLRPFAVAPTAPGLDAQPWATVRV